ncbi:DMT family transporter [Pedosphaera parvula]|uniref:DMT family transporter n=1 Tax=Pedosphaera parvula TaxID=1032527 RepID=UPI001ED93C71|nr:DMT family transporter [Pedosphaera parvula]
MIGGTEANFWRLAFATCFLSIWAFSMGKGLSGETFPIFLLSGIIGIGMGDVALFQALPRLGPGMTLLLTRCMAPPLTALIEWLWLGTTLRPMQVFYGSIILVGIVVSLAPGRHLKLSREKFVPGVLFCVFAALGDGVGAVLSRKAYGMIHSKEDFIDGGTAAFQRIIGGLLVAGICLLVVKWRSIKLHINRSDEIDTLPSWEKWRRVLPWILANSLAGQTLGVSCYQWAFQTTPAAIVVSIVATTPLVAMPIIRIIDGERPSRHSIVGGIIAVVGVVGLALLK